LTGEGTKEKVRWMRKTQPTSSADWVCRKRWRANIWTLIVLLL